MRRMGHIASSDDSLLVPLATKENGLTTIPSPPENSQSVRPAHAPGAPRLPRRAALW